MARNITLLSGASATGDWFAWDGGRGSFMAEGTAGGGSIVLQVRGPNGGAIAVGGETTFEALPAIGNFELPPGQIRAAVSGGSPSGLHASARKIGEA
ncbi:MAG: hypothetical protein AB7F36_16285 [Reyranellaceae bacterium]